MNNCVEVIRPTALTEALRLLAVTPTEYTVCAGGTDIFVAARMKQDYPVNEKLLSIGALEQLQSIRVTEDKLHIGACCTFSQIIENSAVAEYAPLLIEAAARVASPQIRNMATIGGNVCNASPAADGLTALVCLDARVALCRWDNGQVLRRVLPVAEWVIGPGQTQRKNDELLCEFILPSSRGCRFVYEKVGLRSAMAIAVLSLALMVDQRDGLRIQVALGSLGPRTVICREAEALAEQGRLEAAVQRWLNEISPIDDLRSSAEYRRLAAGKLLHRHLEQLLREEYCI